MITIFTDGITVFNDLFQSISNAKKYIFIESYILRNDDLGQKLQKILIEKSKENVKIAIIYDELGCLFTSNKFFSELKKSGIHVTHFFHSFLSIIPAHLNNRNHKKIWVIDGEISYIGGFNIGDEYLGKSEKFGNWRDTHIKLTGVHAKHIAYDVYSDLTTLADTTPSWLDSLNIPKSKSVKIPPIEIIRNDPLNDNTDIYNELIHIIDNAKKYIFIQTPYFIPDSNLLSALKAASQKGVDIKIMIPNKPDHPIVYWGTYYFAGQLLSHGVKFLTYENGFLHAKTLVVDNSICTVGSSNIDMRSFNLNYEINAFIYNNTTPSNLKNIFDHDIHLCKALTLDMYNSRSINIRFKETIARLISPLL